MFFVNFPGCFRHKSQVAETWVLSFQDIFNGINLKPCSMVVESLIYVKIFGGAIQTLKCCTIFCPGFFHESSTQKITVGEVISTPAAVSKPGSTRSMQT